MFCTQCGTELVNGTKFCNNCGNKVVKEGVTSSLKIPPDKILKQGKFELWKKKTFGWPEKGVLTLYSNRLKWEGTEDFDIQLESIVDVTVDNGLGVDTLRISDGNGAPYKFQKIDVQATIAGLADIYLMALSSKGGDLVSWRELIDKLRFNL